MGPKDREFSQNEYEALVSKEEAEEIAERAVEKTLLRFGIITQDNDDVSERKKDFTFLRESRLEHEQKRKLAGQVRAALITALITAFVGLVVYYYFHVVV